MRPSDWFYMESLNGSVHFEIGRQCRLTPFVILSPGQKSYEVHQTRLNHFHSPAVRFHGSLENCQQYIEWCFARNGRGLAAKIARKKLSSRPQPLRLPLDLTRVKVREVV
jgi:hypothetical protein